MFSSLMPQRKEFFDLLTAHADRVVAAANATLRLVNSLGHQLARTLTSGQGSRARTKAAATRSRQT